MAAQDILIGTTSPVWWLSRVAPRRSYERGTGIESVRSDRLQPRVNASWIDGGGRHDVYANGIASIDLRRACCKLQRVPYKIMTERAVEYRPNLKAELAHPGNR